MSVTFCQPLPLLWGISFLLLNYNYVDVVVQARPPMQLFNELLHRFHKNYPEFEPNAIVDIGANKGEWTKTASKLFPMAKFLMIEASPMHNETLAQVVHDLQAKVPPNQQNQQYFDYQIAVLSDTDDTKVMFFQGGDTGNSMFQENTKFYKGQTPVQRVAYTLDTIVHNSFLKNERIDIIKADVQGAELIVFQGASQVMKQASLIHFEGSTVQYNHGGSCTYQVDALLRSYNYYLYDVGGQVYNNDIFQTKGLGQYDVLYIRPDSKELPTTMTTSSMQFCGQDNDKNSKPNNGSRDLTTCTSSNNDHSGGFWKGFVCGVLTLALVTKFGSVVIASARSVMARKSSHKSPNERK